MKSRFTGVFKVVKRITHWVFKTKKYRPLVLRLGDLIRINPIFIFVILFTISFILKNSKGVNLTNSLGISFIIPFLIFFSQKTNEFLKKLKPSLSISEEEYEKIKNKNGYYSFYKFIFVSLLAPLLVIIVNYNALDGHFQIEGPTYFLGLELSKWYAIFTGTLILQMNYITITEVYRFNRIEKKYAIVDLLDIQKLDAFSHIGITAAMSVVGLYTVIPFSILNEPELIPSLISTCIISLPILIINLAIPLYGVYGEISDKLKSEKKIIREAINGNKKSLGQLAISEKQKNITPLDLIEYRRYINELSPIPIAQHSVVRFLGSFIVLVLSWVVPYYYDAFIKVIT